MKKTWQFVFVSLFVGTLFFLPSIGCQPAELAFNNDILDLYGSSPVTLDPAISSEMTSHAYIMQIFSGLVRLDENLDVVPDIAESWERSEDGKTYTFYLRHEVKFHSGREVKASDFKYSWERACDPATGSQTAATYLGDIVGAQEMLAGEAGEISGIKVLDDYTLEVTSDAPQAYFLCKLTYPTAFVVDRVSVETGGSWWRQPDGTGPFKLEEWEPDQQLILRRNELYYGHPAGVKQVIFHFLSGMPMAMYEKGEIDITSVSMYYIDQIRDKSGPFYQELDITPELSLYYIGFDTTRAPFDDINIRRAFCSAVDKGRIVRLILRDMVTEAKGILPPGMPGYNENFESLDYNVEKAKEFIAVSKYGSAANLPPITITVSGYGNNIPDYLGAIVQGWQQNIGVEVMVRQLEPENYLYYVKQERDEMFLLGWVADYPDPHNFLDNLFYTGSENNIFGYGNPELDKLLTQAAVEQDNAIRFSIYQQAEQEVIEEAPCLPLWFGINYTLVKPYVQDYELNPLGIADLSKVWMKQH